MGGGKGGGGKGGEEAIRLKLDYQRNSKCINGLKRLIE